MPKFSEFKISPPVLAALEKMGFTEPTGIQVEAVPALLEHPGDFIGQAQTGTGKTAAFGIPLLERIDPAAKVMQGLVLAPTRELALQIHNMLAPLAQARKVSACCVYGGQDILKQMRELKAGAQLVIGTPGRVNDHLRRKTLLLDQVRFVVLDEADEMLSMGFLEEVEEILNAAGPERRIWLFSATMAPPVLRLTERFLKEPRHVKVAGKLVSPEKTVELYYPVPFRQRFGALCRLIDAAPDMYGIVFCQTKAQTDEVGTQLTDAGYPAATLHGDMTQSERERVMRSFRAKKARVLVATDVAARGLDVDNLSHVINYSLPWDIESYIHRIGRTGRAGREGVAITFIDPREEGRIRRVETVTRKRMTRSRVPGVDQVIAAHVERLKGEFEDALKSAEPFERFIAQMAPLAENRSPQELLRGFATLLCRELFERYEDEKELGGPGAFDGAYGSPAGADGEQVEVYISAGSRNGTTPASLVAALCKTAGLDARQIGRISIKEKASFVILDKAAAQKAIESLDKTYLGGHRIKASLARGPGGPAGPGGPGGPERPARFAGPGRPGPKRARPSERPPVDEDDEDSPGAEDADGSGDAETAAAPPPPRPEGDDRQYTKDEAGPGGPSAPPRKPFKKFAPDGKPGFKPRGFGGPPKFTAAGGGRPFGKPKFGKPKFAKPPAPGGPGLMKPIKTDKPKKPKKPKVDEGPSEGKE